MNLLNIRSFSLLVAICGMFIQPAFASADEGNYEWSNAGTENGVVVQQVPTAESSSYGYSILAAAAAVATFAFVATMSHGVQTVQVPGRTKYVSNTMYLRAPRN